MPAYDVYMLKCAKIIEHINKTEASAPKPADITALRAKGLL